MRSEGLLRQARGCGGQVSSKNCGASAALARIGVRSAALRELESGQVVTPTLSERGDRAQIRREVLLAG